MPKSNTQWITIPEEEAIHTPVSSATTSGSVSQKEAPGKVTHKVFWALGFVVVVVITIAVLSPNTFNSLIQGNLFDAPGVEAPANTSLLNTLNILPAGDKTKTEGAASVSGAETATVKTENVIQPETEPVSIQIEPVSGESKTADTATLTPTETDANRKLLEELQRQVGELKTKEEGAALVPFGATATDVTVPLDLRSSAPEEAVKTTTTLGESPSLTSGYRPNTHKVPVHPQVVLQQNLNRGAYLAPGKAQAAYDARYNAQLSRAYGTPGSGPAEILLIAFLIAFVIMIGWRMRQLAKD